MNKKRNIINTKLKQFGQRLGMSEMETMKSKKTIKNVINACIIASAIAIIGIFIFTRLDQAGEYYMPPSIKDFKFLWRFF
ncbi:MAG: hypothetical protein JSU91_08950 [Thermoplasmatales archaeon]|nr:MAG: hypothetical protein JSU91_08950 [Thermoplasmatales archaeon]